MAEDKETLWKQAQERMAGGMREDARRFFRGFIQRFPQDPRAPQAHLEIGRSYALEGKHDPGGGRIPAGARAPSPSRPRSPRRCG